MIIKTPRGEAPVAIRKAWVGVVLPCVGKFPSDLAAGVLTGEPVDRGQDAYHVSQTEACAMLAKTQPEAVQWWNAHGYPKQGRVFIFYEDEAIVLREEENQAAWG